MFQLLHTLHNRLYERRIVHLLAIDNDVGTEVGRLSLGEVAVHNLEQLLVVQPSELGPLMSAVGRQT